MPARMIEGKPIAEKIKLDVAQRVRAVALKCGRPVKLVAIQVGHDVSSEIYTKSQKKAADAVGICYDLRELPGEMKQADVEKLVADLNADDSVTAVIMQMPMPKHIDVARTIEAISPFKDAEGVHPQNIGKVLLGNALVGPCTAMAVMELLLSTGIELYGKEACVVGHSDIVGKPVALMLLNKFATTTVCHIATGERGILADHVKTAEVLIVAVGKPGVVKAGWIRDGSIVVDVGINRVGEKIVGDVEAGAAERAAFMTPVPGGVGPLTTSILMRNVVSLAEMRSARSI